MKIRSAVFELGAVRPSQWIGDGLPEFAFIGRSNVGKSSLLNRLLGRKALARVSSHPGKTQQINFFRINDAFRLIDLPGYGYAAVSRTERHRFSKMMEEYLSRRDPLVRVIHLIDIRHDPMASDVEVHRWLMDLGLPSCVVATKMDKISKSAVNRAVGRIRAALGTPHPVMAVSAEKNTGIEALWSLMEADLLSVQHDATAGPADAGVSEEHTGKHEDAPNRL